MAILLKGGAVFLHIPKTGGTWVAQALENCNLIDKKIGHKHTDMLRLLNAHYFYGATSNSEYHDAFKFCFVRHPVNWYESWWRYMEGIGWPSWGSFDNPYHWHPVSILNKCRHRDFDDFIRCVLSTRPGFVTELYSNYTNSRVDYVGKYETLADNLVEVLQHLNLDFDPAVIRNTERVNASIVTPDAIEWDPALQAAILATEYSALVRFGYQGQYCAIE